MAKASGIIDDESNAVIIPITDNKQVPKSPKKTTRKSRQSTQRFQASDYQHELKPDAESLTVY